MIPRHIYHYFIPEALRDRHLAIYDQLCTVVIGYIVATSLLIVLPSALLLFSPLAIYYYILCAVCIFTLFHIKVTGRFMLPLVITMATGYVVVVGNALRSGGILSIQVSALYLLLLTGFWADRRVGKTMIFINLLALLILALNSRQHPLYENSAHETNYAPDSVAVAFVYHISITIFFGVFFWMVYQQYDEAKMQIRLQQRQQIKLLNKAIEERTQQLSTMRQTLARDFHDETGNLLSAITRQAGTLRLKAGQDESVGPLIDNIIANSEQLYASSRDFLWSINHNSDDPEVLFAHLTVFGQHFYNQWNIAFSVRTRSPHQAIRKRLTPFVARHIIYIFKEAMTNAAKHSGANEVILQLAVEDRYIRIILEDNGRWKTPDAKVSHSGLTNMKKRSAENDLIFNVYHDEAGTRIQLYAPIG